jgi:hypothetical protein
MILEIQNAGAIKYKENYWIIKYTILHNEIASGYQGKLFDIMNKKIEEYLNIKLEPHHDLNNIVTRYSYTPKCEADEAEFLLKFPNLNGMRFEI